MTHKDMRFEDVDFVVIGQDKVYLRAVMHSEMEFNVI
jgi:predicted RNA-binding protein